MIKKFLNIDIEKAPPEMELEVELQCRQIMESNDIDSIKRYCTHLVRHKLRQDMFLSSLLNHFIDIEFEEEKSVLNYSKVFSYSSIYLSSKSLINILSVLSTS